jgi:hypothetical protein
VTLEEAAFRLPYERVAGILDGVRRLIAVGLAAVALGCTAGNALGERSTSSATATLRLIDRSPVTLRGQGFRARELVRVTRQKGSWRIRATPRGTFVLVVGGTIDRCSTVRFVAVGSNGSRAVLKILPSPLCPPAP